MITKREILNSFIAGIFIIFLVFLFGYGVSDYTHGINRLLDAMLFGILSSSSFIFVSGISLLLLWKWRKLCLKKNIRVK